MKKRKKSEPFMNRKYFLRLYGIDVDWWIKRWDLERTTHPCKCGDHVFEANIPFVQGTLRGLMSEPCPKCGFSGGPFCLVRDPKFGDLITCTMTVNSTVEDV